MLKWVWIVHTLSSRIPLHEEMAMLSTGVLQMLWLNNAVAAVTKIFFTSISHSVFVYGIRLIVCTGCKCDLVICRGVRRIFKGGVTCVIRLKSHPKYTDLNGKIY